MVGWTLVYTGNKLHDVNFIQSLLDDHKIVSVVVNKQDSVYLIGDIELYVSAEDAFNANQLIKSLKSE